MQVYAEGPPTVYTRDVSGSLAAYGGDDADSTAGENVPQSTAVRCSLHEDWDSG